MWIVEVPGLRTKEGEGWQTLRRKTERVKEGSAHAVCHKKKLQIVQSGRTKPTLELLASSHRSKGYGENFFIAKSGEEKLGRSLSRHVSGFGMTGR